MKIAIVIAGGNLQAVHADSEDVEIEVFDYDNEPEKNEPSSNDYPELVV